MKPNQTIVLFDGECALCNGLARWIRKRDPNHRLALAPLQQYFPDGAADKSTVTPTTIVVIHNDRTLVKSDAALQIARTLGGVWKLATVLRMIPRKIRDAVYDVIARHRIKWFGKSNSCELPTGFGSEK